MTAAQPVVAAHCDWDTLLQDVQRVGREVIAPAAHRVDEEARFPAESISALRDLQLLGAYVPRRLGGLGLDIRQVAAICEALGH
jgi:acyl-CoA dehydrogenase